MQRINGCTNLGQTLRHTRIPALQDTQEDYIQQRATTNLKVHQRTMRPTPDQTEHINGLSPTDGRTKRTHQSIARAVPAIVLRNKTEHVVHMATSGAIRQELMAT